MKTLLLIVLLLANAAGARAGDLALASRQSVMSGNFLVGFATLSDRGDYHAPFGSPDATFSHTVADSGGVNGFHGTTPVIADGSYFTMQAYTVTPLSITLAGAVANTLSTPFSYVSAGAHAGSSLELTFDTDVPMSFSLSGQLTESLGLGVNGAAPAADAVLALRGLSTGIGFWRFDAPGSFMQVGLLQPGRWRLSADASTRINASAGYEASLLLTPVPEPATGLLWACAAAAWWMRRRRHCAAR